MNRFEFKSIQEEVEFRKKIEAYYLPKKLIDTIMEFGEIPETSVETEIGVGFIDIANYTFISKFLSPKENQVLLNGLYSVLNHVLVLNGGYLNKIEGDSLMFQYGGLIDVEIRDLSHSDKIKHITKKLFYTCIEMQRYSYQFNKADPELIKRMANESAPKKDIDSTIEALKILNVMRTDSELSPSINALFQINMRIGANIGTVSAGNFGPDGSKHYDSIGTPVINAKRMEATAPVGGLRISEQFFLLLDEIGVADEYLNGFRSDAMKKNGSYANISKEELFMYSRVTLKDKNNAQFNTYSVQVNPFLPEDVASQVDLLLDRKFNGSEKIIEHIQYYRGNRFVIDSIESVFKKHNINIRKINILDTMAPENLQSIKNKFLIKENALENFIDNKFSLYSLLKLLSNYQDFIKRGSFDEDINIPFIDYDQYVEEQLDLLETKFEMKQKFYKQRSLFYEIIFPKIFLHIKASIIEFQSET